MKQIGTENRIQKLIICAVCVVSAILSSSCSREPENPAEAVYFGGDILTMAGDQPQYADALVVNDGKFAYIGNKLDADKLAGKATQQIDLHGATLIPSVISGVQQALTSEGATSASNCWKDNAFNSSADVIKALQVALVDRAKLGLGLFCMGYKPTTNSSLTEADLDAAFPDVSVVLVDASLQSILANSVAKKLFSLETYKSLKNAMRKTDPQQAGLQVGQAADFMILDKNPLKDATLSLASIQITQAFSKGELIPNAPKDLAMLAFLDLTAAMAAENNAKLKMAQTNAMPVASTTHAIVATTVNNSPEKKTAVKKSADTKVKIKAPIAPKVNTQLDAKAEAAAEAKQAAKRSNLKTEIVRKPMDDAPVSAEPAKPKEVRFNMTQDGKKMTPEDFDAWMKAQGIRIVPAKPVEAPLPVEKK